MVATPPPGTGSFSGPGPARPAALLYLGDYDASGSAVEGDGVQRTDCWERVERVLLADG
ncbi:hypothetical protein ACOKM5_07540 [Streptomyces sp. BH097]|uniref:hypothetical protein n=1 Tax=unclassified Streptomyces TaxID=2593676 RepID=UPI003BB4F94E